MITEEKVLLFVHNHPLPADDGGVLLKHAATLSRGLVVLRDSGYPEDNRREFERLLSEQVRPTSYVTNQEAVALRALRLVCDQRLKLENLQFFWLVPESGAWVEYQVTPDGDLEQDVPGGFFDWRSNELF